MGVTVALDAVAGRPMQARTAPTDLNPLFRKNAMPKHITAAACCLAAMMLVACDRERLAPPMPRVESAPVNTGSAAPIAGSTSVPAADEVFSPATSTPKPASTSLRSNKSMTSAEESSAMPLAGQNNDHSAPNAAAARASGPR